MAKLSPHAALGFLMILAAVSWAIVVGELALTGAVSAFAIANAAVFTVTLALWPLLAGGGTRAASPGMRMATACAECGTLALPVPGIRFCIQCGAYPKARGQPIRA